VFSFLPGTGKTTVAKALAAHLSAVYLRIDTIEHAMRAAGAGRIGPAGYEVANPIAATNLRLGHNIVADCVNPVRESRSGWANIAAQASAKLIDINLICSDPAEHRRRVEQRCADISGHILPTWHAVTQTHFEPRDDNPLTPDTATMSPAELTARCAAHISANRGAQ
jgi:predicted kinase